MSFNPWQVDNIQAFYVLKCPECNFIHHEEGSFQEHAVENHPLSAEFFANHVMKIEKIDDCNQENESNDDLIALKEEILGTKIDREISEPILENENYVKLVNINNSKPLATVNQSNDALIVKEAILIPRNDHETSEPILENENYVKLENMNVILLPETVNDICPRTNQFQQSEKSQLSEIFQVPKVPEVHDTKRYKCLYCGESFMRRKHLKNHMASVHEGPKLYYCPHCNGSFENKEVLQSHILSVIAPFKCSICDYGSTKRVNLKKHISKEHEDQKPFRWVEGHFNPRLFNPKLQPQTFQHKTFQP